jgi:hypothetical protein
MSNEVIIDIEDYAKNNKAIPKGAGHKYKVKINQGYHMLNARFVNGADVLAVVGKEKGHHLNVDYGNGNVQGVALKDKLDLHQGVVKFMVTPMQASNGYC